MTSLRSKLSMLSKQTRWEVLQYALFRWENAVVLAGAILLTGFYSHPFPWWPIWGWLLLGVVGIIALIMSSLSSQESNERLLLAVFQEQFNPRKIKNPDYRKRLQAALEYQRRIALKIRQCSGPITAERSEELSGQVTDWIQFIYRLAVQLDAYRQDSLLELQRSSVPEEIRRVTAQRQQETNPLYQHELDQVLVSKRKLLDTLQALETRMKQAEYQMEQSLAALATVDSQIQLIDAQSIESGRSERLMADISEQVNRLNDLVSSLDEVYQYQG